MLPEAGSDCNRDRKQNLWRVRVDVDEMTPIA